MIEEYYFDEAGLIFVFEQEYRYNRPIYWDAERAKENGDEEVFDINKSVIIENRYYFNGDEMVRWLDRDYEQVPHSQERFDLAKKEVLAEAQRFIQLLNSE